MEVIKPFQCKKCECYILEYGTCKYGLIASKEATTTEIVDCIRNFKGKGECYKTVPKKILERLKEKDEI